MVVSVRMTSMRFELFLRITGDELEGDEAEESFFAVQKIFIMSSSSNI